MIENLWSTPVAVYDTHDDWGDFEGATNEIVETFPVREPDSNFFMFKEIPALTEFSEVLRKYSRKYSIESGLNEELLFWGGFFNIYQPGMANTPHGHPRATAVAVYVAQSDPDHGDLLLHDPRGAVAWKSQNDEDSRGKNNWRTFQRFPLGPGQLIFFPGYVVHSVETNVAFDKPPRLSIGINLYSAAYVRQFNPSL
jgi:hypothetical protein